jgi:TolA-binding protein
VVPLVQAASEENGSADELQQQISALKTQAEGLRNTILQNRSKVKLLAADTERLLR